MKIGLLGVGTVGGGVVNVLANNATLINQRANTTIEIVSAAVKSIAEPRICDIAPELLTQNAMDVVNHPEVEVVLELIGGIDFAKQLVETALNNGKHVITANKALIANHGNELLLLAKKNSVALLFEASVAGGIPILKSIQQGLSANKIQMIAGIINGTGNFILTEMSQKNRDFASVLKQAQELGYAEADPTYDVEGIDAAHKLAILSTLSFGHALAFDKVATQGISQISDEDINFAKELGYNIKHLGVAKQGKTGVEMRVHPALIPTENLLGQVNGVMNAVFVKGNAVGDTLYYGAGAGADATASAVLADLIDLCNNTHTITDLSQCEKVNYIEESQMQSAYYLRLLVADEAGVLAEITHILSAHNISVETVVQHAKGDQASIAITTNNISAEVLALASAKIQACEFNQQAIQAIRIETLT